MRRSPGTAWSDAARIDGLWFVVQLVLGMAGLRVSAADPLWWFNSARECKECGCCAACGPRRARRVRRVPVGDGGQFAAPLESARRRRATGRGRACHWALNPPQGTNG